MGRRYTLPSTAYVRASPKTKPRHLYFKIPVELWESGHIQAMSAAALAMILVLLSESSEPGRKVWWSTDRFPEFFNISPAMRSRGTRELVQRRLLHVEKQLVGEVRSGGFGRERVRNRYQLINEATPKKSEDVAQPNPRTSRKPRPPSRSRA